MKKLYLKERLLGLMLSMIYRLYSSTFRYEFHIEDQNEFDLVMKDVNQKRPEVGANHIFAFWHQDELSCVSYFSYKNIVAMVSKSKDGTIMDTALRCLGYLTVRGSSSKGAVSGFRSAYRMILNGHKLTMAVDGPRGPIYKTKIGVIKLSEKSKRPIVPIRAYPEKYIMFEKSWDKAKLPKLFTKIHFVIGRMGMYTQESLDEKLNSLVYEKSKRDELSSF